MPTIVAIATLVTGAQLYFSDSPYTYIYYLQKSLKFIQNIVPKTLLTPIKHKYTNIQKYKQEHLTTLL